MHGFHVQWVAEIDRIWPFSKINGLDTVRALLCLWRCTNLGLASEKMIQFQLFVFRAYGLYLYQHKQLNCVGQKSDFIKRGDQYTFSAALASRRNRPPQFYITRTNRKDLLLAVKAKYTSGKKESVCYRFNTCTISTKCSVSIFDFYTAIV